MNEQKSRSWIGQIVLFFVLSLLFSALPFLFALFLNKSSLGLAIITAWYAAFPPLVALVLSWLLYRGERSWIVFVGRLWVSVGLWFGVQALLMALIEAHLLVRMFALPATLAGGKGYTVGAAILLIGGIVLWVAGRRLDTARPDTSNKTAFAAATAGLLGVILVGLPLLIGLTSCSASAIPDDGPELPSTGEVFGYVKYVYELGTRRPGWPATEAAKDYIA
ncbi:MAG: hypothetical protein JSU86_08340, partial [Phycisphaerales bacterium]